jgi:beta-lactamase family protein
VAGRERGLHAARTFPMASTLKVMLMAAYLRRPSVADRRLHGFDRRLLVPMIRRSDDDAATRVRDIVGPGRLRRLARRAGMHRFHYNRVWGLSRTSPRDQARFMDRFDRFIPARHRAFARHQLAHIVPSQRWGIGRLRLPGWRLYFKGGWGSGSGAVDHQIAFLESGSSRVALAIYTQSDGTHHYGKRTLSGIAARLLDGLPSGQVKRLSSD